MTINDGAGRRVTFVPGRTPDGKDVIIPVSTDLIESLQMKVAEARAKREATLSRRAGRFFGRLIGHALRGFRRSK